MRKLYLLLGAAAVMASASANSTDGRINLSGKLKAATTSQQAAATAKKAAVTSVSNVAVRPLQAPGPKKASVENKTVILYEDFANVPAGNTETIGSLGERYTDYIASHYYEPGRYIDNDYTPNSGTWEGDFVMAGNGGTVILQCYNPQSHAQLNTPLGDYSGDISVTVKCRYAKTFWGWTNDLGYTTTSSADLTLAVFTGGYDSNELANTDARYLNSGQWYEPATFPEGNEWHEITFNLRNESANKDSFISFYTGNALEIDWIKICDNNTFLAEPKVRECTNFTNDGFTVNWDLVRRSNNYYIDLWKTVYTADSGLDEYCDFEDGSLPEWLIGEDMEFVENGGSEGTGGMQFVFEGEDFGIATADLGKKLESFSANIMINMNMYDPEIWDNMPTLWLDVYGENGWEPYGYIQCDGWYVPVGEYAEFVLDGEEFADMFTAVRLYAENLSEESTIFIDDISVYAKRPYILERVKGDKGMIVDPSNDDYGYNYYVYTAPENHSTSYTFTGLDPETEYWYRVRSHYMQEFNGLEKHHAFGVAAPELLSATDINESSFTANWNDAPKAQKYTVKNYTATVASEDDDQYSFMVETFFNCNGEPEFSSADPLGNAAECYLDDYTDLKGWRGKNNTIGENMIGTVDFAGGYIITPEIMVNPDRGTMLVYMDLRGYYGDYLYIQTLKGGDLMHVQFNEDGEINGWLELPAIEGEQIKFNSYYGYGIALCEMEVVQAVKAGDIIRNYDSVAEVPAGVQSYTFSNLNGGMYSYTVISNFTLERETAYSTVDKYVTVDISNGNTTITNKIDAINNNVEEVARYSVDGVRVNKDYKGIVIIKMNDGSISKQIVK